MKRFLKTIFSLFILFISIQNWSQNLTGTQLLEKAIAYHDPNNQWKTFSGHLSVTMEIPNKPNRDSNIFIDLPKEFFSLEVNNGKHPTIYNLDNDQCSILFDGRTPTKEEQESYNLNCDRASLFKNYYTYLYGLPMKLQDPGTIIHNTIEEKIFKGKPYWVLKVTYEKVVGSDIWYFYFDPSTYKMEVYQFFHDEAKNDGEYILLSDEVTINGIKMPKIRAWYTNAENKYLGTDILNLSKN